MPVEWALGMWEGNCGKAELPKIVLQPDTYNLVTLIKIHQLYNITSLFYIYIYIYIYIIEELFCNWHHGKNLTFGLPMSYN